MATSDIPAFRHSLQVRCKGDVLDAPAELDARATDFGGMYHLTPALVLRPSCVQDVQAALRFAGERELAVSLRGMAHSQSGHALGSGLLLDMTSLNRVLDIDPFRRSIEVEAGITWSAVVDTTFAHGLLPVALTYALDTTVGGTLSVGGIGAAAWSYGPQVDNLLYLDVVTSSGELVRCSNEHERELFDAVRGGLGQCGVIVRAGIPLRPCGKHIETRGFVYREMEGLLFDAERLSNSLNQQRLLSVRLGIDPLAPQNLLAALFIGRDVEPDGDVPDTELTVLREPYEIPRRRTATWTADGIPEHSFFRVYGAPHQVSGEGSRKHPWMDFFYTLAQAPQALATLAAQFGPILRSAPSQIIFVKRGSSPAPLLVTPESPLVVGLGMFPTFSEQESERAREVMSTLEHQMLAVGGKRYLSGYFGPSKPSYWANHYAGQWPKFQAAKLRFDPVRRFETGVVRWPDWIEPA